MRCSAAGRVGAVEVAQKLLVLPEHSQLGAFPSGQRCQISTIYPISRKPGMCGSAAGRVGAVEADGEVAALAKGGQLEALLDCGHEAVGEGLVAAEEQVVQGGQDGQAVQRAVGEAAAAGQAQAAQMPPLLPQRLDDGV